MGYKRENTNRISFRLLVVGGGVKPAHRQGLGQETPPSNQNQNAQPARQQQVTNDPYAEIIEPNDTVRLLDADEVANARIDDDVEVSMIENDYADVDAIIEPIDDDVIEIDADVLETDVKLQRGVRREINSLESVRLGDHVDINFADFVERFDTMRDGDSFIIGREVNGVNDIRINNEFVSGQHLKVEKINGEIYITDMSTNGTTLNTTKPDYAAQYSPQLQQKFGNANITDFSEMIDDNYRNLRRADYSLDESVSGNITNADLGNDANVNIFGSSGGSWFFRYPKGHRPVDASRVADRISLNVVADNNLLAELDRLCATGTYVNANGQTVRVNMPDCTYKTPQTLEGFTTRHDPITMYFEREVSEDVQNAIADIAGKYARQSSNGKSLMNALEGKPYIAHEAYISPQEAQSLWHEAKQLNPSLAKAIFKTLNHGGSWNVSTGNFAACKKLVEEYKLFQASNMMSTGAHWTSSAHRQGLGHETPPSNTNNGINNFDDIIIEDIYGETAQLHYYDFDVDMSSVYGAATPHTAPVTTPINSANQTFVNVYPLNSYPNAKLKEYSYTISNGMTFKFMAAEGIDAKNINFLANIDFSKRIISSKFPKFSKFSDATQFKFAKLYSSDKARQSELFELALSLHGDEKKLYSILSNKDLLDKRLADITELKTYFSKIGSFQYLDGLLDIKNSDPVKFERIKSTGIFDLVKEGKLEAKQLGKIGIHSDLSPEIYSDLELLKSGKSIVPEFAEGTDLKTAFEQTKLGDAVEVGGKMYLNDGNSLIEWNMTKEKYLELFPPVQRFATAQGTLKDCYLVQTLGLAMHNPQARVEFLQSFSLKGDDVVVTVKGLEDYHGSKTFKEGNINLGSEHCLGCKGIQMYEQTYAIVALREITPVDYPNIASIDNVMQRVNGGQAAQTMADVFGQGHFIDLFPGQRMLKTDRGMIVGNTTPYTCASINEIPYKNPKDGKTYRIALNKIDNVKTRIQLIDKVFNDYPNKSLALHNLDLETTEELLKQYVNDTNYLFSFGTISKTGSVAESNLLPEYNLVSGHAYSILGYDESTKMVKIGNPHSYGEVTEIPLETLHQYIRHIDFLKL